MGQWHANAPMATDFRFGGHTPANRDCCGKPAGCTNTNPGCCYLHHPRKRAMLFNDPEAPCQSRCLWGEYVMECTLKNGHSGPCEMVRLRNNVTGELVGRGKQS